MTDPTLLAAAATAALATADHPSFAAADVLAAGNQLPATGNQLPATGALLPAAGALPPDAGALPPDGRLPQPKQTVSPADGARPPQAAVPRNVPGGVVDNLPAGLAGMTPRAALSEPVVRPSGSVPPAAPGPKASGDGLDAAVRPTSPMASVPDRSVAAPDLAVHAADGSTRLRVSPPAEPDVPPRMTPPAAGAGGRPGSPDPNPALQTVAGGQAPAPALNRDLQQQPRPGAALQVGTNAAPARQLMPRQQSQTTSAMAARSNAAIQSSAAAPEPFAAAAPTAVLAPERPPQALQLQGRQQGGEQRILPEAALPERASRPTGPLTELSRARTGPQQSSAAGAGRLFGSVAIEPIGTRTHAGGEADGPAASGSSIDSLGRGEFRLAMPRSELAPTEVLGQVARHILQAHSQGQLPTQLRLNLNPEDLGQLEVKLRLDGDRLHVGIVAQQGIARELLQDNLTSLRALLADQGLDLGDVDVRQQDSERRATHDHLQQDRSRNAAESETATVGAAGQPRDPTRLVDAFV